MIEQLEVALIAATILAAIVAVEHPRLIRSVAAFLVMSVLLALIFLVLNAPLAAFFQLLIYAGAVIVLFLAALHTIRRW